MDPMEFVVNHITKVFLLNASHVQPLWDPPGMWTPCRKLAFFSLQRLSSRDLHFYWLLQVSVADNSGVGMKTTNPQVSSLVNIQRSPLGGRSFESYAEDPFLSGTLAASYVNGLQGEGVGAVIKHFVANDQEDERMAVNSEVDERTLRGELRLGLTTEGERAIFTDAIPVWESSVKKYT
jgi:hypothetical protein